MRCKNSTEMQDESIKLQPEIPTKKQALVEKVTRACTLRKGSFKTASIAKYPHVNLFRTTSFPEIKGDYGSIMLLFGILVVFSLNFLTKKG
jgi:hypothetical protein